jgi:NADH-quinone oxidoreductase subunit N
MNYSLLSFEILVTLLGVGVLLADLWTPDGAKKYLGWGAAGCLALLFFSGLGTAVETTYAFRAEGMLQGMYVQDSLSVFFRQFFLLTGVLVLVMSVEFSGKLQGIGEYYSLILFALLGMLFCAATNDFILMFVSLELIAITFVILNCYQRNRQASLEAGIKYLIVGATASAFMIFGIALIFGSANTTNFGEIYAQQDILAGSTVFQVGILLVLVGLGFKIAAFPFHLWAPDVYQGAPTPTAAFLAVGSKAAGVVLLLRIVMGVVPALAAEWSRLLIAIAGVTVLYGSLCAIPQRSIKRLMGYSSIANAGFLLFGVAALSKVGAAAVLYYMAGYLFTVLAAFSVLCVVMRKQESDDISSLAGLGQRSPLLAVTLSMAMVSLAGIPPLAGFVGKFLLLKSIIPNGAMDPAYYILLAVGVIGAVISIYYYFGVVRAMYWGTLPADLSPIPASWPLRAALVLCIGGMLWLGVMPDTLIKVSTPAVEVLAPELPESPSES